MATVPEPQIEGDALSGRTRFFIRYAKEHGVHLSAFLFLIAHYTRSEHRKGKRGRDCGWHQNVKWFAKQLGVTRRTMLRLIARAKVRRLLGVKRTTRGLLVWVHAKGVYTELKADGYVIGHYWHALVDEMGLNASIIFMLLKQKDVEGKQRRLGVEGIAHRLPWMSIREIRYALDHLVKHKFLNRYMAQVSTAFLYAYDEPVVYTYKPDNVVPLNEESIPYTLAREVI